MSSPPRLPPRPKAASLFMAAPVVFLGGLGLAVAVLFVLTRFGDTTAQGERVAIEFSGSCVEEAQELLTQRAAQIGMPAAMNGATMETTLPEMNNARVLVSALLVQRGDFTVQDADGKSVFTNTHIDEVAIDLDEVGMPVTFIKLDASARASLRALNDTDSLVPVVDGSTFDATTAADLRDEAVITLHSGIGMTADRMKRAADLAIILEHGPLPCSLSIKRVTAL